MVRLPATAHARLTSGPVHRTWITHSRGLRTHALLLYAAFHLDTTLRLKLSFGVSTRSRTIR